LAIGDWLLFVYWCLVFGIEWLFGTAGGAAGCRAASTGRTGGALKLSTAGKSKGRHHPMNFFALTFGAGNFFGGIKY